MNLVIHIQRFLFFSSSVVTKYPVNGTKPLNVIGCKLLPFFFFHIGDNKLEVFYFKGAPPHGGSGSNFSGPPSGYNSPLGSRFPQPSGPGMTQQFSMSNQGQ